MRKSIVTAIFCGILLLFSNIITANPIFSVTGTIITNGTPTPFSENIGAADNIEKFIKEFDYTELKQRYTWNSTSTLQAEANLRGFKLSMHYTANNEGHSILVLTIPSSSFSPDAQTINELKAHNITYNPENNSLTFTGPADAVNKKLKNSFGDRSVWDQLLDVLQGKIGSGELLHAITKAWIANTAIDPVAGNPDSFMAALTNYNFNFAGQTILNGDTSGLDLFSLHPSYSSTSNNGFQVTTATLPLAYTHYFNRNNALMFSLPIQYQRVNNATTYSAALGIGYTHVMLRTANHLAWSLSPSVYAGAVGSLDLGSGTGVYDTGLASRLQMPIGNFTVGMTNDVSYLSTMAIKIGDVKTPYDFDNWITKNGIDATYRLTHHFAVGGFYNRTDVISGETWYISNVNEVGFRFAKLTGFNDAEYDFMNVSVGYLFANHDYDGVNATLTFNF